MKKRLFSCLSVLSAAAVLVLSLSSCAGAESPTGADTGAQQQPNGSPTETVSVPEADMPAKAEAETYTCYFDNGVTVTLGAPAAKTLEALGTYADMMEAPSCVHEGFDRVYTYSQGYRVTTQPSADGAEYVYQVELVSDLAVLVFDEKKLMIGSPEADAADVFGEPAEDAFGVRSYQLPGVNVTVVIDDGYISALTFAWAQ